MDSQVEKIIRAFEGKIVGTKRTKKLVAQAVLKLPKEMQSHVTHHLWFFSTDDQAYAYAFHGNDLKDQHFIFLSDDLLAQHLGQIYYTILHEIGHIILEHKNSIEYHQAKHEISQQESEADQFAKKYL